MSERPSEKRERDWEDRASGEEENEPASCEETYRDGSARNECWHSDR